MAIKQFNLTIEEKVLLHLMGCHRSKDDYEVPSTVTQPGIALSVSIRRSHVSYVIKGLKKKGFVHERIAHVENLSRKRKVYFLTEIGFEFTTKLKMRFGELNVHVKSESGELKSYKFSQLQKEYTAKISLIKLLNLITPEGVLEDRLLKNDELITQQFDKITPSLDIDRFEPVKFIDDMPQPTRFIGRESELERIVTWFQKPKPNVIVIKGIPGVGKTTLAGKIVEDYSEKGHNNLFWYRVRPWSTVHGTLLELSEFLYQLSRKTLKHQLEHEKELDLDMVGKILELELSDIKAMLVFDDFQKCNDELKQFMTMLIEFLVSDKNTSIKLLILTRTEPGIYDRREVAIKGLISELELIGLNSDESRQLLNLDMLTEPELKKIYQLTEGHPLTLQLISNHILKQTAKRYPKGYMVNEQIKHEFNLDELFKEEHDINKYIRKEIFEDLTTPEIKLMNFISIYRYPIPSDALFLDEDLDYECIDGLVNKSMLHETNIGFESHELIKEFFYRRLTPNQRNNYHQKAAEYYLSELETEQALGTIGIEGLDQSSYFALEAQYHYIQSRAHQKAAEIAVVHGEKLISKGYSGEFFTILQDLDMNSVPRRLWTEIMLHKGRILIFNGNWDMALQCFNNSLEIYQGLKDDCGMAKAYNAIGAVHYRKGDWKTAKEYYDKGLERAVAANDDIDCSKVYSNIAMVHWSEGDLERAIELIKKSLTISEKLNDTSGIARAYNNLGIIYWEQRKLDLAIEAYEQSLAISRELMDKHTIAILYDNLGEAHRLKGNLIKAEELYNKSLELSEELGFKWQIAEVNYNLGLMYKDTDPNNSKKHLKLAFEIYTLLGAQRELEKVKVILN